MQTHFLAAVGLAFLTLASCTAPDKSMMPTPARSELPGPQRAADAIRRTLPIIAPQLRALGARAGDPVLMRAFKTEKILEMWIQPKGQGPYVRFAAWPICAASGIIGPKLREGDKQVPEGVYAIPASAMNMNSSYHLSMDTGYPNALDRSLERTGSEIMVHGRCASVGCLAMTDPVMEQVWTLVDAAHKGGQSQVPVYLFPFAMSQSALAEQSSSPHFTFWSQLKLIYDEFENTKRPVSITMTGGRYRLVRP